METKIRLARCGRKKQPFYRIVVSPSAFARDGRFLDIVGRYDPSKGLEAATIDANRVNEWIKRGAHMSTTVRQILKKGKKESKAA